mmetsp:Transcript_28284/g.83274  ORF Transcript_28284/g.83274 Transcript_28284/m.83274 type:complete len:260 (-) Transcript_28284:231-1010(-)
MVEIVSAIRGLQEDDGERMSEIACSEIICYGIGNFSEPYSPSMLQLACVLQLRRELSAKQGDRIMETNDDFPMDTLGKKGELKIHYFEPEITPAERRMLADFGVEIIEINEEGKRRISDTSRSTLFYMPHCPMRLYSNVLWANWDPKLLFGGKLVVFGNDFNAYDERTIRKEDRTDPTNCILQILPYALSTKIQLPGERKGRNSRPITDDDDVLLNIERAFSDTSVTWFQRSAGGPQSDALPIQPKEYLKKNDNNCELL